MTKSALQIARAAYQPKVPAALKGAVKAVDGEYTQSVADQDEIADRAVESRQDGSLADRLQDHVDNPGSNVFGRGVAVRLSEVGGGGVQRQVGQGPVADVLYLEVDIRQGPFPGHFSDQFYTVDSHTIKLPFIFICFILT